MTLFEGTTDARTIRDVGPNKIVAASLDGSKAQPRRTVVTTDKCNRCHYSLSFHGGIDEQELLPHGTAAEVYAETTRIIGVIGVNGGYVVAAAHNVQGDTPPENVVAMCQAARDCRRP